MCIRGQFIVKYLGITFMIGVLILLIFLYADMKIDIIYYRLQVLELQEKQEELKALTQSYRSLVTSKILQRRISLSDLDLFLPQFEKEVILQETMGK